MVPQNPQNCTPLRPIVSSRDAVIYGVAKELASITKPLVGHFPYQIRNKQHFVDDVKTIQLQPGESMVSYDVKTLFTSVAVDPVKYKLQQDCPLP